MSVLKPAPKFQIFRCSPFSLEYCIAVILIRGKAIWDKSGCMKNQLFPLQYSGWIMYSKNVPFNIYHLTNKGSQKALSLDAQFWNVCIAEGSSRSLWGPLHRNWLWICSFSFFVSVKRPSHKLNIMTLSARGCGSSIKVITMLLQ